MRIHQHAHKIWLLSLLKSSGSLAGAAQEAKVSISAISQSLAQLEEALCLTLLDRTRKTISLTRQADDLLHVFSQAIELFDKFDPEILNHSSEPKRIRIGAYESIAIDLLPQIIPQLRRQWKNIEVEIEIARSRTLIEKCNKGELDLVFVADATHAPNLLVKPFLTDDFGLFISSNQNSFTDLNSLVCTFGLGSLKIDDKHHTASYKRFLKNLNFESRPTLETESFEVILALVRGGAIAGILPLRVAQRAGIEIIRIDTKYIKNEKCVSTHDLSLACHNSFSNRIFNTVFEIVCTHTKKNSDSTI